MADPQATTALIEAPPKPLDDALEATKKAIADRNDWENRLRAWYSQRYGLRAKKVFPWPGSSNLFIPLTDKVIRRLKPSFLNATFGVSPIVGFEPLGNTRIETTRAFEAGYDWLVRSRMKSPREALQFAVDNALGFGFGVVKSVWEFQAKDVSRRVEVDWVPDGVEREEYLPPRELEVDLARRLALDPSKEDHRRIGRAAMRDFLAGAEYLEFQLEYDVTYNAPRWHSVDPIDFIVPWDSDLDIDNFPLCTHRFPLSEHQLKMRGHTGFYPAEKVKEALESLAGAEGDGSPSSNLEQRKQLREGIKGDGRRSEHKHEMWEVYYIDGIERRVATVHARSKAIMFDRTFDYEHDQWPFTRISFEQNENRWYAGRGIPEMLYDLQSEVNAQHNAKLDNMAISTSKSFIYRQGSITNPAKWVFRPGAMFPVRRMDDVQPLVHQQTDWVHNNEEMNLRQTAEEYIGTPDFGISNINQRVERRTATEIDQIQASTGIVAEETLQRYQTSMRRLHQQTAFLWRQFGDEQVEVRVTGSEEALVLVRFDLYQAFDMVPTGRLDNATPSQRIQKASVVLSLLDNPRLAQHINDFEVTRDVLENLDYRSSKRYLNPPGLFETTAVSRQIHEITQMEMLGEIFPVDQGDPHEIHLAVLQKVAVARQGEPELLLLLAGHAALHQFFLGERGALEAYIQQTGAQVQEAGTRLILVLPEGGEGAGTPGGGTAQSGAA